MNPTIKRRFKDKILDVVGEFNLNDISMISYSRQFDAKTQLSATDMAYAISALLETPMGGEQESTAANLQADAENQNPNRNHLMHESAAQAEKEAAV